MFFIWTSAAALWLCWTQARPGVSLRVRNSKKRNRVIKRFFTNVTNVSVAQVPLFNIYLLMTSHQWWYGDQLTLNLCCCYVHRCRLTLCILQCIKWPKQKCEYKPTPVFFMYQIIDSCIFALCLCLFFLLASRSTIFLEKSDPVYFADNSLYCFMLSFQ